MQGAERNTEKSVAAQHCRSTNWRNSAHAARSPRSVTLRFFTEIRYPLHVPPRRVVRRSTRNQKRQLSPLRDTVYSCCSTRIGNRQVAPPPQGPGQRLSAVLPAQDSRAGFGERHSRYSHAEQQCTFVRPPEHHRGNWAKHYVCVRQQ
jgi:hypothetical protein